MSEEIFLSIQPFREILNENMSVSKATIRALLIATLIRATENLKMFPRISPSESFPFALNILSTGYLISLRTCVRKNGEMHVNPPMMHRMPAYDNMGNANGV
jgi:hypothetical protein